MNEDKSVLKAAKKSHHAVLEKSLHLETPTEGELDNEVIKFRREFYIPLTGFKFDPKQRHLERDQWFMKLTQNKIKFEGYQQRLRNLAAGFGFDTPEEMDTLEEYLQTGDPIVVSGNFLKLEAETDKWQPTRVWGTAPLARRLKQMRREGKSYQEIAGYFNKIKPANAPVVTTVKLRQIISRADRLYLKKS